MELNLKIAALVIMTALTRSGAELEAAPRVQVEHGTITGFREQTLKGKQFFSFLNIPFAKPPVGYLRFKDPVPPEPWDGIRSGSEMPQPCYQFPINILTGIESPTYVGSEDCLYLNVYTRQPNVPEAKLPVMVYIHGGSFISGSSRDHPPYVLLQEDIILVVIQYRLGIFGFFSTGDSMLPGNMGLKDQQLALKWVQDNIRQFGGDPDAITIFGESAGGSSVHFQVLSPGSKGLFKRAIIQSGSALCPHAMSEGHRRLALEAEDLFGCSLNGTKESFLKCMQEVDVTKLLKLSASTVLWGERPLYILPRVDGDYLPESPELMMKNGNFNKVDLITGITKDEGIMYMIMLYAYPSMIQKVNENFTEYGPLSLDLQNEPDGEQLASEIYQFYLQQENITLELYDENLLKLLSDENFVEPFDLTARALARDQEVEVYTYRLDYRGKRSLSVLVPGFEGSNWVSHGDDLFYLFDGGQSVFAGLEEEDFKVREIIVELWTNFAKHGKPTTTNSSFSWNPATLNSFKHLSITKNPKMEEDDFSERREFWRMIQEKQKESVESAAVSREQKSKKEL